MRKCSPEMRNGLKTAFKRVIADLGGLACAAECTRVGISHLSDYGNVESDKVVPIDVVLDLEMISGPPHITAALAAAQGRELVVVTPLRPKDDLAVLLARIGADSGALFGDAAEALAHKKLTPREKQKLTSDLAELLAATREAYEYLLAGEPRA